MTTSVYFNHIESTPEQNLHQDLIIEAIKNYGIDVYYLPRKYVTALFKRQWGANLIKYDGVQLPGGVNLNGRQLFEDATQELNQIEEDMQLRNDLPVDMMIGAGPF